MSNENEFLFELTAPFGTKLLTVRNIPYLTASAVWPLLPDEDPRARLPAAELSSAQTQALYRTMTIGEHRKRLYDAIKDGRVEVLSHNTRLPLEDLSSPLYVDWQLISLRDFIRFANTLKIRVLIGAVSEVPFPAAPVVADGIRWTPERLAELKAYRENHSTKEAAKQYGITAARIRKLLPGDKPTPKSLSIFTHHSK